MMAEIALPKIRVTDSHNREGSTAGTWASGRDSLSTTDGGHSQRPHSMTSSEGNIQANGKKASSAQLLKNTNGKEVPLESPSSPPLRPPTAIDPLSHHILQRTNTESIIPQKLRNGGIPDSPKPDHATPASPEIGTPPRSATTPELGRGDSNHFKEKRKGVSFFSRLSIIGSKKKDPFPDGEDNESETGDSRTEGMNAHVFSSSIGANGYIPQHKEPPKYIKVRAHNKKDREFNRMFLAQELSGTKHASSDEKTPGLTTTEIPAATANKLSKVGKANGAVWATEFSKDGKYLAAAGRDQVVRVWAVISTPEERQAHEREEDAANISGGERLSAPVFRSKPIREFEGHVGDILDLSWSKNNFLLSSSMDKTVRLWHISRQECLCTFKHKDFVTSIAFHPRDDRFFLAGSLDSVLRLWSIPDKSVAFWNQLPDLITAVAFTPDGKTAMAGVLSGLCLFYETEGLKYHTQIHVRSSRGKNAKGSKITGIRAINFPPDAPEGEIKVLITSNDSRVRMYNLRDKSLEMKFRGHENTCSQINASFSEDAEYIICGSEDRKAFIWSTTQLDVENKDKRPVEFFEAHSDIVTAAVIAPTKSRQLLSASGDPIYDLCNPPPVTLLSREESNASSIPPANGSEKGLPDPVCESPAKKPEESPAYLARCSHTDGNIIITADYLGGIKVFRQDCAFQKRRMDMEAGSLFSKKMLGRSNSIMTRHSGGSISRRNSLSQSSLSGPATRSDHILSWRNSVNSNVSLEDATRKGSRGERSISPGKFNRHSYQPPSTSASQHNLASAARQQPYIAPVSLHSASISTTSPTTSIHRSPSTTTPIATTPTLPPQPGFTLQPVVNEPSKTDNGKSYTFWGLAAWRAQAASAHEQDPSKLGSDLRPGLSKNASYISKLSSDEDTVDDASSDGEALVCRKCKGKDFRARRVAATQKLVCTKCGTTVD